MNPVVPTFYMKRGLKSRDNGKEGDDIYSQISEVFLREVGV